MKRVLLTSNGDDLSLNLALSLLKNGCRVVLAGNKIQLSNSFKKVNGLDGDENTQKGITVVDLDENGNESTVNEVICNSWKIMGQIDALVHCYGYEGDLTTPLDLSERELDKILKFNFKLTWMVCKALGRQMREHKSGGSFILLTSIIGTERGLYPGSAAYGSCLAAENHLARALALELGKYHIRVNAVARGLHDSDAFVKKNSETKNVKSLKGAVPLQRWLDVKNDLASLIFYLVDDDSSFITGTVIFADGGQSIVRPRMRSYM
eukprot:TRINITY_DN16459_c0_g1_i1.p1 TRINITY_DN16459_c0_g1~~TRINITY_DN16459_c0_g1_i1.p1  ORF type:complete len:265 (-),score=40.86 TRINITY_DN16459_c0_g1_i1:118-912(-)